MFSQLLAHMGVNFKFYRRNRLVLVTLAFVVFVMGLSFLPSMFFLTKSRHLELIKEVLNRLSWFTNVVTACLGLFFVSQHIRDRSTKMVFTKPCLPEVWLFSGFFSAAGVALALYTGIFLICSLLSLLWNIPFQWGIAYIAINNFLRSIIVLSYITFLSVVMHPVAVVFFMFIFHETVFYSLKPILLAGIDSAGGGASTLFLMVLKAVVDAFYIIVPSFKPFSEMMVKVESSLRLSDASWMYLFLTSAYAASVSFLFYLLSVYFLKKKKHI